MQLHGRMGTFIFTIQANIAGSLAVGILTLTSTPGPRRKQQRLRHGRNEKNRESAIRQTLYLCKIRQVFHVVCVSFPPLSSKSKFCPNRKCVRRFCTKNRECVCNT